MKYFDLSDDVSVPNRWHLGEVFDNNKNTSLELWLGKKMLGGISLRTKITHPGVPLDFCLTSFADPIAESSLAELVAKYAGLDVQLIPIEIEHYEGDKQFQIINSVRTIQCLDENRSHFTKWTAKDHRADLAGQYRTVSNLKLDSSKIPIDAHFFRVEGWRIALVVSEELKFAIEASLCVGTHFVEVS